MPTTYTNGLKLPDLGSIDWYNSYKNNIDILDPIVGTVNGVATTYAPISHNHSASEITSGTIDIARLPPAALERMHIVADQTARYALTTSTVQEGDTVKQTDTGVMYLVVDSTKLNSADGYTEYSAGTASKAIADEDGTSIKTGYVNVAGNQTVTGDKSFTGSNTFNSILPNATNTYSLGSSSYQWSSVYAQTYYYNGTAWGLDKSNTWTQSQTIKNTEYQIGEIPSAAKARYINFTDKNNVNIGWIQRRIESSGDSSIEMFVYNRFTNSQPDTAGTLDYAMLKVGLKSDQTHFCEITGDTYPRTNNTYNLGTSTNQWKSVYSQTYYYNGTPWGLDKANVWTQTQSVVNAVNPKFILQDTRNDRTYSASTALSGGVMRWECDDKDGVPLSRISTTLRSDKIVLLQFAIYNEDSTGTEFDRTIRFAVGNTGSASYYPTQTGTVDLGNSTYKWKTLNGINPGALSLPKNANSASFNIDTTNWTTDGSLIAYTPLLDGWLYINARNDDTNGDSFIIFDDGVSGFGTSVFGNKGLSNNGVGLLCLMMPVNKNNGINIRIKSPGLISARLYPCNGNV